MTQVRHVERVMGTAVRFAIDGYPGAKAIAEAVAWLHWVDETFSVFRSGSEIMRIRDRDISEADLHADVAAVLDRCAALRIVTGGRFDHRPDGNLDPSGFVKGWAIERAADILIDSGLKRFYIDAGGDIVARGRWDVGIRNPADLGRALISVELTDQAIATSGAYERGEHIWGDAAGTIASASIIGPDLGTADALSTALFSSGGEETAWLDRFPEYRFVLVTNGLEVFTSPGQPDSLRLASIAP